MATLGPIGHLSVMREVYFNFVGHASWLLGYAFCFNIRSDYWIHNLLCSDFVVGNIITELSIWHESFCTD